MNNVYLTKDQVDDHIEGLKMLKRGEVHFVQLVNESDETIHIYMNSKLNKKKNADPESYNKEMRERAEYFDECLEKALEEEGYWD